MANFLSAGIVRRMRRLMDLHAYTGKGNWCVVCGRRSARFAPFGLVQRPSARCVRCNSLERHRFMWLYLAHCGAVARCTVSRILHFAPEPFLESRFASLPGCEYVTVDIEPGRAMVVGDITNLPFTADSFDLVICSHVLEHIPDDAAAIRELYRVVADGGSGLLMVPLKRGPTLEDELVTSPADRARLFGQSDHVRIYGDDFASRLEAGGFVVEVVRPQDLCSLDALVEMGIPLESERIFRVSKEPSRTVT